MEPGPSAILLNEGARSGRSERVRRTVELARRALGAELRVIASRDAAEIDAWLRQEMTGFETVVVVGGDGTLGIAFGPAAERDVTLGWIPGGFGNATAHLLGLPRDPEGIAEVIAALDARPIDLVGIGDRLALFAGAGWDALVAGRYAAGGARGHLGWASAIGRSAPALWQRPPVEVTADGWTIHRGPMALMVVSTTPFYGRGLRVNPGARPTAGRLSCRVYPGPAPRLALEAIRWASGITPKAERVDGTRIELRALDGGPIGVQTDGDLIGEQAAWRFEVRPGAVRLIGRWS